jgi:NTE family protein
MIHKIENLALEGGGVWGIAYAGAIEQLDKVGFLGGIKHSAGTLAGSVGAPHNIIQY